MLQVEVDQRYTAAQVLDHLWVNVGQCMLELHLNMHVDNRSDTFA